MASIQYGAAGLTSTIAPGSLTSGGSTSKLLFSARVKDIILDDSHPRFYEFGEWNGIGTIFIETTFTPALPNQIPLIPAYPAYPNIKQYPLINELVPILYLADPNVVDNTSAVSAYYLPPINAWNSQIHNAVPSTNELPPSQQKDYQQVEAGSVRRVTDESTEIELGKTFNEDNVLNIYPLLPYEGDIVYEGRYGNSIRFGSTVNNAFIPNSWSSVGENGNPITIIRNGQSNQARSVTNSTDSWIPTLENINEDKSSIYLASTQRLPIRVASTLRDSYAKGIPPLNPELYYGNQIVLNSNRLVFNAKNDSIILSAENSIHLTSNTSINIDGSKNIVLSSPKVYLGSSNGKESTTLVDTTATIQSAVKGENLNALLSEISLFLTTLSIAFRTATDSTGVPIVSLNTIAAEAESLGESLDQTISNGDLLSKQVKIV